MPYTFNIKWQKSIILATSYLVLWLLIKYFLYEKKMFQVKLLIPQSFRNWMWKEISLLLRASSICGFWMHLPLKLNNIRVTKKYEIQYCKVRISTIKYKLSPPVTRFLSTYSWVRYPKEIILTWLSSSSS